MKWLKGGKNVLYAIDQDYGWTHSSKLRFFNQEAATITTAAKILALTNCNLLFLNSFAILFNSKTALKVEFDI